MARRSNTPPPPPPHARLTAQEMRQGIERLKKRIAEVEAFDPVAASTNPSAVTGPLEAAIKDTLGRTFGTGTVEYGLYKEAASFTWPMNYAFRVQPADIATSLTRCKQGSLGLLHQAVASLEERLAEEPAPVLAVTASQDTFDDSKRDVFLVHGRDTAARESVARFLERADFSPIILSEQTNRGRTLIEKFEEHSNVGFAVVLLTPDDVGGLPGLVVAQLQPVRTSF